MKLFCALLTVAIWLGSSIALRAQLSPDEIKELEAKAARDNPAALYRLGTNYDLKSSEPLLYQRALPLISKSANQGYPPALIKMGDYYLQGKHVEADKKKALDWYRWAANKGDLMGQLKAAHALIEYGNLRSDDEQAYEYLLRAERAGSADATEQLMLFYSGFRSGHTDLPKFVALLAKQNDFLSLARQAVFDSTTRNLEDGYYWYRVEAMVHQTKVAAEISLLGKHIDTKRMEFLEKKARAYVERKFPDLATHPAPRVSPFISVTRLPSEISEQSDLHYGRPFRF